MGILKDILKPKKKYRYDKPLKSRLSRFSYYELTPADDVFLSMKNYRQYRKELVSGELTRKRYRHFYKLVRKREKQLNKKKKRLYGKDWQHY